MDRNWLNVSASRRPKNIQGQSVHVSRLEYHNEKHDGAPTECYLMLNPTPVLISFNLSDEFQ